MALSRSGLAPSWTLLFSPCTPRPRLSLAFSLVWAALRLCGPTMDSWGRQRAAHWIISSIIETAFAAVRSGHAAKPTCSRPLAVSLARRTQPRDAVSPSLILCALVFQVGLSYLSTLPWRLLDGDVDIVFASQLMIGAARPLAEH